MAAATRKRVQEKTDPSINRKIRWQTDVRLAHFKSHPEEIQWRLSELDREWDIERALATGSTSLTLTGLLGSILGKRSWLLLSLVVQGFYMQHALEGWCPPLPVFRSLGFRTTSEINYERQALLAQKGHHS